MTLLERLGKIEGRPGMYLGTSEEDVLFQNLVAFIHGYEAAVEDRKPRNIDDFELMWFTRFVTDRLGVTAKNSWGDTWESAIRDSRVADRERFDLFFQLLHEFLGQTNDHR